MRVALDTGWHVQADGDDGWLPASVPGTAADAVGDADRDYDADAWIFRTQFDAEPAGDGEEVVLHFDGIATVADVLLNGEVILQSGSMFTRHAVDVGGLLHGSANELVIRCHALRPLLAERRKPRARWRTRLADNDLRWFRTTLLGRAPGIPAGPAAVGPWGAVSLERRGGVVVDSVHMRARVDGSDGVLSVRIALRALAQGLPDAIDIEVGGSRSPLTLRDGTAEGELRVPGVERWWPHTHGKPVLYDVRVLAAGVEPIPLGRVGFRELTWPRDIELDGLALHVNGVSVFLRGAVWTPVHTSSIRETLETARDCGLNMIRVPGTARYESAAFYDACDELGLFVWQDFMYANFDYPFTDADFLAGAEREATAVLRELAGRASVAVLCGNSEVEQQVAMLGLDPALGRDAFFREVLPALVAEAEADAAYVPSAPFGGDLPFRTDVGVSNYYGVGGYRRGLDDVRRARVRFAAECLALANVPDATADDPRVGVPRDVGADWDFVDVRDHYVSALYDVNAATLDPSRYDELSRTVTGELMAEVFGEWRRTGSPCGGALVLWLRDLVPGSGWGLLDSTGVPKAAWHHLRRALAPVAVWMTDEGLNGIDVHIANDRPEPLRARLRIALYRDFELAIDTAERELDLPAHTAVRLGVEELLGRFVDASYAYRFGPPGHHAVVASIEDGESLLSQAFRFPGGRPIDKGELGLNAAFDGAELRIGSRRLAYGVRVHVPGFVATDDSFCVEPGHTRSIALVPTSAVVRPAAGTITAVNLDGELDIAR